MAESKKKQNAEDLSYEQAVSELEQLIEQLEDGKLSLEESLNLYERGVSLSAICHKKLNDAELRIKTIQDGKEK